MLTTKYTCLYFLIALAGAVPLALYGVFSNWAAVVLALLWILVWAVVFYALDVKKIRSIWEDACRVCRPDMAVQAYEQLLAKKRRRALKRIDLMSNLTVSLLTNGQDERALALLLEIEQRLKGKKALLNRTVMLNNRCVAYLHLGDYAMAGSVLEQAKRNLLDPAFASYTPLERMPTEAAITGKVYTLNVLTGNMDGAERYLRSQLEVAGTPCERVALLHLLGLVCQAQGRAEEARACFAEGAENGGTTWAAGQCRQRLSQAAP